MIRTGFGLVLVTVLVGGCTNAVGPQPSSSPSASGMPTSGLRGDRIASLSCSATLRPASDGAITGVVISYIVCPLSQTLAPGQTGTSVTVPASSGVYSNLDMALRSPDGVANAGVPCPAYADAPRVVLGETTDGYWVIRIPQDGCRHYFKAFLLAVAAAEASS